MKYKKIIIRVGIVILLALLSVFACKQYYNLKFISALDDAAQISPITLDDKYKNSKLKNKYKIALVLVSEEELNYGKAFEFSSERLGWETKIFKSTTRGNEQEILEFNPDFIIFSNYAEPKLSPKLSKIRAKKYMLSFSSLQRLREEGQISKSDVFTALDKVASFNKITDGVLTSAEVEVYQKIYEKLHKNFVGLKLLPLLPRTDNEPAKPQKLLLLSKNFDKKLVNLISKNIPTKTYKTSANIEEIRENGVYLLNNPSLMTIFTASAANAVIISNKQPFTTENFGDNILYYDSDASNENIYKQIKAHMDWASKNPKDAKAMAARAHQTFLDKYTLEKDLIRIARMHEYARSMDEPRHP